MISRYSSESDHKAALIVLKVRIAFHDTSSMKYLTPYSYRFIAKQISLIDKVKLKDIDGEQSFHTSSSEGELTVSCSSCTCMFWQSIKLPCRHIFAARSKLDLNLFNEGLCDRQWSAEYFQHNQRIFVVILKIINHHFLLWSFHHHKRKLCHRYS